MDIYKIAYRYIRRFMKINACDAERYVVVLQRIMKKHNIENVWLPFAPRVTQDTFAEDAGGFILRFDEHFYPYKKPNQHGLYLLLEIYSLDEIPTMKKRTRSKYYFGLICELGSQIITRKKILKASAIRCLKMYSNLGHCKLDAGSWDFFCDVISSNLYNASTQKNRITEELYLYQRKDHFPVVIDNNSVSLKRFFHKDGNRLTRDRYDSFINFKNERRRIARAKTERMLRNKKDEIRALNTLVSKLKKEMKNDHCKKHYG